MTNDDLHSEQTSKLRIVRDAFFGIAVSSGVGLVVAALLVALVFSLVQ